MAGSDLRLLIVTRIWPTPDAPSSGIFVANRCRGMRNITIARAMHQHRHWTLALLKFVWDTVRVRGQFDGVEAHVVYPAGLVGWITARVRRVPILVYAHGTDVREAANRGPGYRMLTRWVIRHADAIVTNSGDTRTHVRRLGGDALIAPPGIPLDRYRPTPRPTDRRVVYLGGRNPRKGHEVAVGLADTMVGPGIREVPPAEIPELMAAHDVVLVPSTAEPFGLVAVEGIASGRWVVANDVGGLRDIVIDGVNGTLVADGDFAGALARVPDYDPDEIAQTVQRFSIERWQADLDSIWRGLLAKRHRRG
jgi:glycosyltransferase involved in cell wall biosynthesis